MRVCFLILVTAACVCTCPFVFADTTWVAPGDVSGSWTHDGSPYMILGDLRVPPSETLSIGPGVTVFFAVRCSLFVDSAARLEAIGAQGDSVYFTTDTLMLPERWKGIKTHRDADTCRFEWSVLEFASSLAITAWETAVVAHACAFRYNQGGDGGAIAQSSDYLELTNCVFESNIAGYNGGALLINNVHGVIEDCQFRHNRATGGYFAMGGAIDWWSQFVPLAIRRCDFMENSGITGGAVALEYTDTSLVFEDCRFVGNTADSTGGAVSSYVIGGSAQFRRCLFDGNRSHKDGGALYVKSASVVDQCVFTNNMADSNGGAVFLRPELGDPVIYRSTFYHNRTLRDGAAIYLSSWASVQACIFVRSIGDDAIRVPSYGDPPWAHPFRYNLFFLNAFGNFSDNNAGLGDICCANRNGDPCDEYYNVVANPQFADTATLDFHLLADSPCIDAGPDSVWFFPFRDPDGTVADIGAFYYDQTQAAREERTAVRRYELAQNYPNPFNSATRIEFDLTHGGDVQLSVFDITGRRVAELINEPMAAGHHTADFDAARLPSGVYFYRLRASESVQTRKMILLK